ncbi:MAG: hypothetical protein KME19_14465 [Microcoleus vaginatus WJT46-NPBG5]|nr:hypothetical protein [Microcoleus vaginatus WJT46-NPBG5]
MKSHIVEAGFVKERLGKRQGTYRASHKFCRQLSNRYPIQHQLPAAYKV